MDKAGQLDVRQFSCDYNNPSDLRKLIRTLSERRRKLLHSFGYREIGFNGSKIHADNALPVFDEIFDTDLSDMYWNEGSGREFYVYAHCDPTTPLRVDSNLKHLWLATRFPALRYEPFYVGKGKGQRMFDMSRTDSHRKIRSRIKSHGGDLSAVTLIEGLTSGAALAYEAKLLDILGLITGSEYGMLCNLDEGLQPVIRRSKYSVTARRILVKNGFEV